MVRYQHILAAVGLDVGDDHVAQRAREIAKRHEADLSLVHVVEEVAISAGYELMPLLPERPDESVLHEAEQSLAALARRLELDGCRKWAVSAISTREGVLELARVQAVDLIVIGSHPRHGLAALLGSNASALVCGAPCDVLAVRL